MKLLAELTERSLGISDNDVNLGGFHKLRKSARGIILNEKGEMAVQHIQKYNYHKLPGGGMEPGEMIDDTLRREILEEVGCACEGITPIGIVIEYRSDFLLISYCYSALVVGPIGIVALEPDEIENEHVTL